MSEDEDEDSATTNEARKMRKLPSAAFANLSVYNDGGSIRNDSNSDSFAKV